MARKIISFTYELRDLTFLQGWVTSGNLLQAWYMTKSYITMDAHVDAMSVQGWKLDYATDLPGGQRKIAFFSKEDD